MKNSISSYKRNLKSILAENILGKLKIYINTDILNSHILLNKTQKGSIVRIFKEASENDGFIKCRYYSRNKKTFRLFTAPGSINLINESDPVVLSSIVSRYNDGYVVEFDYITHEYNILCGMLGLSEFPEDIHTFVQESLNISRKEAKLISIPMLYGRDQDFVNICKKLLSSKTYSTDGVEKIILTFKELRNHINKFISDREKQYKEHGYVVNSYGRKIWPKDKNCIFNNVVQSIGAEVLIEDILSVAELGLKNTDLMFHKFDSLIFDIDKQNLSGSIRKIRKIMENINQDFNLRVKIKIGKNMADMQEL